MVEIECFVAAVDVDTEGIPKVFAGEYLMMSACVDVGRHTVPSRLVNYFANADAAW